MCKKICFFQGRLHKLGELFICDLWSNECWNLIRSVIISLGPDPLSPILHLNTFLSNLKTFFIFSSIDSSYSLRIILRFKLSTQELSLLKTLNCPVTSVWTCLSRNHGVSWVVIILIDSQYPYLYFRAKHNSFNDHQMSNRIPDVESAWKYALHR